MEIKHDVEGKNSGYLLEIANPSILFYLYNLYPWEIIFLSVEQEQTTQQVIEATDEPTVQKINSDASDFVKSYNGWNTKKKKLIETMADNFANLIRNKVVVRNNDGTVTDYSTYTFKNISGLVCDKLEENNVPATAFGYVRALLAKKDYTDSSIYQQIRAATKHFDYNDDLATPDFSQFDYIPRDIYQNLPLEEKIRIKKEFLARDKERKMRSRENRTMMDEELEKEGINPDSVKDSNIDSPPPSLWGKSYFSTQLEFSEELISRFKDILHEFIGLAEKFKPEGMLDQKAGDAIKTFNDIILKTLVDMFSGYSDQKNAYTFPQWIDKLVAQFDSVDEFAIPKKSLLTGEFATMDNDGNEIIIPLERKITNKHVKDRLEQIELVMRKMPLFTMLFSGLELYVRNQVTVIGDNPEEIAKIKEADKKIRSRDSEYYVSEEQAQPQIKV